MTMIFRKPIEGIERPHGLIDVNADDVGAERLGDRVEVAAVRRLRGGRRRLEHLQAAVPGRVRGAVHAEHAGADHWAG